MEPKPQLSAFRPKQKEKEQSQNLNSVPYSQRKNIAKYERNPLF